MPDRRCPARIACGSGDCRRVGGKHDGSGVSGCSNHELYKGRESGRDRVIKHHSAGIWYGACKLHDRAPCRVDRVRGDGMGVGDVSEMHGGGWNARHSARDDDSGGAIGEPHGRLER